jgi:outer membrane protein TolC
MRWFLAGVLVLLAARSTRGEEVELSLPECLRRATENALQIREGRYLKPIASTRIMEAESEFDHLLSFQTKGGDAKRQTGSVLGGADVVTEQTFHGGLFYDHKIRTGGRYTFGFQTDDLLTNNEFYRVQPLWSNAFTFTINQPVLRTAGSTYNLANIRIAEADSRAAAADYIEVVQGTLAATERAYWDLIFLREDLAVKQHSVKTAEELVRIADKRRAAGAGTRVDYVQAEAGLAAREKELILAEQAVQSGEDRLRSYVFPFTESVDKEVRIVPTETVDSPVDPTSLDQPSRLRRAFDNRPDVLATKERLEAAGIRVVQAENELLPRLDVFGTVGLTGLDDSWPGSVSETFGGDFNAWEVGLSFEIPIGNLGARARHRRAVLERSRAVAGFDTLKNQIVVAVRDAIRNVVTAQREIEATGKAVVAAQAQYDAEVDRVKADRSTAWQLLQIEDELSRAKSQEILAKVAYRRALVALEEATGTYLEWRGLVPPPEVEESSGDAPPTAEEEEAAEQPVKPGS